MPSPYLLVTGDFVKTGGMDRANFALADYLARQGHEVHLVAHRVASELLNRANTHFHPVPKLAQSYWLSSPLLNWLGQRWAKSLSQQKARVLVNGGNCQWGDVNWVHYVHAAYQPEIQADRLRKFKGAIADRQHRSAERKALQAARIILVNSDRTKQDLVEKLALPDHKIKTVYYGVDPQVFYPATDQEQTALRQKLGWAKDRPIVVFIGALGDRRKGFDTLFAAWQQLCAEPSWDVDLKVIGRGAELAHWQQRTLEASLVDRIQFLGFRSDVPNLLRAADCLVAPTRYEAYGLGVHEALCCGLPSIVSASAGVAERYTQAMQPLLLPNPDDRVDLVTKLRHWRSAHHHYRQVTCSLAETLRAYTWDQMAQTIWETISL